MKKLAVLGLAAALSVSWTVPVLAGQWIQDVNRAENSGSVSKKGEGVWVVSDMVGPPFCCLDTAYNLEYTPSQALFAKNPKKGG